MATPMQTSSTSTSGSIGGDEIQIDEGLYSRQLYTLGVHAMKRMMQSSVLICGLKGLGVEIAKNVVLAGVKSVSLVDDDPVEIADLSSQFYLGEKDVGQSRAAASAPQLAELNGYVQVHHLTSQQARLTDPTFLRGFNVVVMTNNKSLTDLIAINAACRSAGVKFIAGDIRGLFAQLFVDLGASFECVDADGEEYEEMLIDHVSQEANAEVTVAQEGRHNLQDGDVVRIWDIVGMSELNDHTFKVTTSGVHKFKLNAATTDFTEYQRGGYFKRIKVPVEMKFLSLEESLSQPEILVDFSKFDRQVPLHLGFTALLQFHESQGRLPRPRNDQDAATFMDLVRKANTDLKFNLTDLSEKILQELSYQAVGDLSPMSAFLGGIAAQEVLKAISGKFTPVKQFFYFDALEALPSGLTEDDVQPLDSRYDGQIAVFGRKYQELMNNQRWFLVGAGAIGCEMLKNWGMMGLSSGANGNIIVTDMDTIEKSNLNRQFLFRPADVTKLKSQCAAKAVKRMNPLLHVEDHANRVGKDSEEIYDDAFFDQLDGVCNALDNVEARLYMDSRCVYYLKPLLESGTQGTKGNTQVIVPGMTESYGSSNDPPEKSIPLCTLKNFPHKIEHTIHWARDQFAGLFTMSSENMNAYLTNARFMDTLPEQITTRREILQGVYDGLVTERPASFEHCVEWARHQFQKQFHNTVAQLLYNCPLDMITKEGAPFWSGVRRPPKPLDFDADDALHMEFVIAAANLRAENYGLKGSDDVERIREVLLRVDVPKFKPISEAVDTDPGSNKSAAAAAPSNSMDDEAVIKDILKRLPAPSELSGFKVFPADFDKDNDANRHIDFITACSNLRATNYNIGLADRAKTKQVAGKIIPAIATTTALVSGLVCLELYKLLQRDTKKIEDYRNSFANLALSLFAFSEPVPPEKRVMKREGRDDEKFTLWDRFEVDVRQGMTTQQFMDLFKEKHGLEISMVSCGSSLVFMDFMPPAKRQARLKMELVDAVQEATKTTFSPKQRYFVLVVTCANDDGEDVDAPYVRVRFR